MVCQLMAAGWLSPSVFLAPSVSTRLKSTPKLSIPVSAGVLALMSVVVSDGYCSEDVLLSGTGGVDGVGGAIDVPTESSTTEFVSSLSLSPSTSSSDLVSVSTLLLLLSTSVVLAGLRGRKSDRIASFWSSVRTKAGVSETSLIWNEVSPLSPKESSLPSS